MPEFLIEMNGFCYGMLSVLQSEVLSRVWWCRMEVGPWCFLSLGEEANLQQLALLLFQVSGCTEGLSKAGCIGEKNETLSFPSYFVEMFVLGFIFFFSISKCTFPFRAVPKAQAHLLGASSAPGDLSQGWNLLVGKLVLEWRGGAYCSSLGSQTRCWFAHPLQVLRAFLDPAALWRTRLLNFPVI